MANCIHLTYENMPENWNPFFSKSLEFSNLLKETWLKLQEEGGIFKYNVGELQNRHLQNRYGYLLQLNPERALKRRQPVLIKNIKQDFDPNGFNFSKVSAKEILFLLARENDVDTHTVIVNVSPISRYHSLLCPSVQRCLPQVATEDSLVMALEVMFMAQDRDMRIGFNSLCAMASVNHLHYHILYETDDLAIETVKCQQLIGPIYYFKEYPCPGFCFEVSAKQDILTTSKHIHRVLSYFIDKNIAHNLLISRGGSLTSTGEVLRVVLWPRKSSEGAKKLDAFNVAVCELAGWFPIYNKQDFENLTVTQIEDELRRWRVENFEDLCKEVVHVFSKDKS